MTQIPYLDLVTPPASEPVTVSEMKLALRIDGSTEDTYIFSLIKSARNAAEEYLRRSLITQVWQLQFDNFVPSIVALPKGSVQEVNSVKIISQDFSESTISTNAYRLNAGSEQLIFDAAPIGNIVQIRYTTGYGSADDVPAQIKQGIINHVIFMYENRGDSKLPQNSAALYSPYKLIRF